MNLKDSLTNSLVSAIAENTGVKQHEIARLMEKPKNREHGDVAFPCFILAKPWKISPPSCAERLKAEIELPHGFSSVQAAGPYLNFKFDRGFFIQNVLREILLPLHTRQVAKTVIVEYSSPNIAKPFHVGHLRATLIGNCLDRMYRYLGWRTISINHLGDWGTQFGFVWAGCKLWGFPEQPTVSSLVELYRRATALKSTQEEGKVLPEETQYPDINEMARGFFLDLEKGEEHAVKFWQQCVDTSLEYLKATYKRLDITFNHYTGESFYSDKLEGIKQMLEASGLLVQSHGALGVDLGEQLGFARVFTPDGRSLYLTRDLATAKYRAETFNFDKSIYVVGAPQTLHFQQLKAVLRALKLDYADRLVHVAFGHVLGMKTRGGGDFIELNEFLDEAYERALDAYHTQVTKRPEGLDESEVARAVALSAILFSNLSRTNIKDVTFKWEHALEFQGDSGPYLLYACARINGIKEKASAAGLKFDPHVDFTGLIEDSAYELVQKLTEFDEVLEHAAEENEPSYLANYALELAKTFSQAYLDLKVIGEQTKLAADRLALFEAARIVLGTSLRLLGIAPLERM
jgi:arginyl-tRNA synthetase